MNNNAINKEFYFKHGFVEDTDKKMLFKIIANHKRFKEVNMTVSVEEPNMILARVNEGNVIVGVNSIQDKRLILEKNNKSKTVILNILLDEITDCLVKEHCNKLYELQFLVRGFRYGVSLFV